MLYCFLKGNTCLARKWKAPQLSTSFERKISIFLFNLRYLRFLCPATNKISTGLEEFVKLIICSILFFNRRLSITGPLWNAFVILTVAVNSFCNGCDVVYEWKLRLLSVTEIYVKRNVIEQLSHWYSQIKWHHTNGYAAEWDSRRQSRRRQAEKFFDEIWGT